MSQQEKKGKELPKKDAPKKEEPKKAPPPPPPYPGLDPAQARMAKEFKHSAPMLACRFTPSGKFLYTSGQDNTLQRWELASGKKTDLAGHSSWVRALAFQPKGPLLISGGYDGQVFTWNAESPDPIPLRQVLAHQGWVRGLDVDATGNLAASCGNDGKVCLWNLPALTPDKSWQAHEKHAYQVLFHPSGKELVSVDLMGNTRVWDLAGKMLREGEAKALHKYDAGFGADIGGARAIAFSPDGNSIVLAGITNVSNAFAGVGNPILVVLDWATLKVKETLQSKEKFQGTMWGVAWHKAGFLAATAGGNGGMLWFFKPGAPNEFASLKLPDNARDLALHPEGKSLAIPFYGSTARIYDLTPKS